MIKSGLTEQRLTPKKMAATILADKIQVGVDYWSECFVANSDLMTAKEQEAVTLQLEKYEARLLRILKAH